MVFQLGFPFIYKFFINPKITILTIHFKSINEFANSKFISIPSSKKFCQFNN